MDNAFDQSEKTALIDLSIRDNLAKFKQKVDKVQKSSVHVAGNPVIEVTIPVTPESLNEVMTFGATTADVMQIKKKWEKLAISYFREAQTEGTLPEIFKGKIEVRVNVHFEVMRIRDQDNYFFVAKGIIDAIKRLGMVEDDNSNVVDFGGIYFFKDKYSPRVVVQILDFAGQDKAGIVSTRNVADIALEALGYDKKKLEDYTPVELQIAYMSSLPRTIRPSPYVICTYFNVEQPYYAKVRNSRKIKDLILEMVRHNAAYDMPDVIPAIKLQALDGNVAAQRLYLEYVGQLDSIPASFVQNNTFINNSDKTREKIAQLEFAYADKSQAIIEGETVD